MSSTIRPLTAVTLPAGSRACASCADSAARGWRVDHQPYHRVGPGGAPARWRVAAAGEGGPLAVGTALRLEGVGQQNFTEFGGFVTADWLFTALDGPSAGTPFYTSTAASWDGPPTPWPVFSDLFPPCLEPEP